MERFAGERLFNHQPAEELGWGAPGLYILFVLLY
jgi:hypothetical protein